MTQQELKKIVSYCPDSGIFTWIGSKHGVRNGTRAGSGSRRKMRYRNLCLNGTVYHEHRIAFLYMTGRFPEGHVDHIDGDGHNNAWHNLRVVSPAENLKNKRLYTKNQSGVPGVRRKNSKWLAAIGVNGECLNLGLFLKKEDAVKARLRAEEEYGYHSNHGRGREKIGRTA